MRNMKVRPYFDRCLVALAALLLFSFSCYAETPGEFEEKYDPNGLVEVHVKADPNAPYNSRKTDWSWRFVADYEAFYPNQYVSLVDGAGYATIFGSNQGALISGGLGVQYNTKIGALFVDGIYGTGGIKGVTTGVMQVSKYGLGFGYMLDTLSAHPWVSPFVAGQAIYFGYNETDTNISSAGTTQITTGVMAGLSIHLDKIDPDAARNAYMDYGIRNTFLDIYAVQYNTSNSKTDPNLQTTANIGAGLHVEF